MIEPKDCDRLVLLPADELSDRIRRIRAAMAEVDKPLDAILITDNAEKYYVTGRVFAGYIFIPAKGEPIFFVCRPIELKGDGVVYIRKPEDIPASIGLGAMQRVGMGLSVTSYSTIKRLAALFPGSEIADATPLMRRVRSRKTDYELQKLRVSGSKHMHVYSLIPGLFRAGMSDIELQVEIERASRLEGCLGQFRISGDSMELYMGNVLVGENADAPSPYDFAMGGAGMDPSLPVGANGTLIRRDTPVMVDMNGNFDGYMTDMTRVFCSGELDPKAVKAHRLSVDIHHELVSMMHPGTPAKALCERAAEMVEQAGMTPYYMGHRQHAKFIGHGVGIEINELPVIAPRSRDILEEGNVIALEPKFVIPHVGAVGIENTYAIHADRVENLTPYPEEIQPLYV